MLEKKTLSCAVCHSAWEIPHPFSHDRLPGFVHCITCDETVCEGCSVPVQPGRGDDPEDMDLRTEAFAKQGLERQCHRCWSQTQANSHICQAAGHSTVEGEPTGAPIPVDRPQYEDETRHKQSQVSPLPSALGPTVIVAPYMPRSSAMHVRIHPWHHVTGDAKASERSMQSPIPSPVHTSLHTNTHKDTRTCFDAALEESEEHKYPLYAPSSPRRPVSETPSRPPKREWFFQRWIQSLSETYFAFFCHISRIFDLVASAFLTVKDKTVMALWELFWVAVFCLRIGGMLYVFVSALFTGIVKRCREDGTWRIQYERLRAVMSGRIRNQYLPWWTWLIVPVMSSQGVHSTVIGRVGVEVMEAEGLLPLSNGPKPPTAHNRETAGGADGMGHGSIEVHMDDSASEKDWSNVYAEVSMGQHECVGMATRVIPGTTNPVWREQFEMPIFSAYATVRVTLWHLPRLDIDTTSELKEVKSIRKDILPRRVRIFETIDKETGSAKVPEYGLNAPGEDVAPGGSIYRDYMAYAEEEESRERQEVSVRPDQVSGMAESGDDSPLHPISPSSYTAAAHDMSQAGWTAGQGEATTHSQIPPVADTAVGSDATSAAPESPGVTTIRRAQYNTRRRQPLGEVVLPVALFSDQRPRDIWVSLRPCGTKTGREGVKQILRATDNVFGTRLAELEKVVRKHIPNTMPVEINTQPKQAEGEVVPVPAVSPPPYGSAPLHPPTSPPYMQDPSSSQYYDPTNPNSYPRMDSAFSRHSAPESNPMHSAASREPFQTAVGASNYAYPQDASSSSGFGFESVQQQQWQQPGETAWEGPHDSARPMHNMPVSSYGSSQYYIPVQSQGIPTHEGKLPSPLQMYPPTDTTSAYQNPPPTATAAASEPDSFPTQTLSAADTSSGVASDSVSRSGGAAVAFSAAEGVQAAYTPVWTSSSSSYPQGTARPHLEVPTGRLEKPTPQTADPSQASGYGKEEGEIPKREVGEKAMDTKDRSDRPTKGKKSSTPVAVLSDAIVHDYGLGRIRLRVALQYDPVSEFWSHFLHSETPAARQRTPFSAVYIVHLIYRIYEQIGEPLQKLQRAAVNVINWDDPFLAMQTIIFLIIWGYWPPLFLVCVQVYLIQDIAKNYVNILLATVHQRLYRRIVPSTLKPAPIVTTAAIVKGTKEDEEPVILKHDDIGLSHFLMPWRWKRKSVATDEHTDETVSSPMSATASVDQELVLTRERHPRTMQLKRRLSLRSPRYTRPASVSPRRPGDTKPLSPPAQRTGTVFQFLRKVQSNVSSSVADTYSKLQTLREDVAHDKSFTQRTGAEEVYGDIDEANPAWERFVELLISLGNKVLRHAYDTTSSNTSFKHTSMTQREARHEMRRQYLKSDDDDIPHVVKRDVPSVRVIVVHRQKRLVLTALGDEITDFSRAVVPNITKEDVKVFAKRPKLLDWRRFFRRDRGHIGAYHTLEYPHGSQKETGQIINVEEFSRHSSTQRIADLYKSQHDTLDPYPSEALRAVLQSNSMMAPIAQHGSIILNSVREYSMPPVAYVRTVLSAREAIHGKPGTTIDQKTTFVPLEEDITLHSHDLPASSTVAGTKLTRQGETESPDSDEGQLPSRYQDLWNRHVRKYFVDIKPSSGTGEDKLGMDSEAVYPEASQRAKRKGKPRSSVHESVSKPIPIQANARQVIINSAVVIHDPVVASSLFKSSWESLQKKIASGQADEADHLEYWNYNQEFSLPEIPRADEATERDIVDACLPGARTRKEKWTKKLKDMFKRAPDYRSHLPSDQTRLKKFAHPKIFRSRKVRNAGKTYGGDIVQTRVVTGHRDLSDHVEQAQKAGQAGVASATVESSSSDRRSLPSSSSSAREKGGSKAAETLPQVVAHLQSIGFENAYIPEEVANIYIEAIEGMEKQNITQNILDKKRKSVLPPLQQFFDENQDLSSVVTSSLSTTTVHDVSLPSGCVILKGERTQEGKSMTEVREKEAKEAADKTRSALEDITGYSTRDPSETLQGSSALLRVGLTLGSITDRIIPAAGIRILQQVQDSLADVVDVLEIFHYIINFARIKITRRVLFLLCLTTVLTAFSSQRQLILGNIIVGLAVHTKPVQHFLNIIRGIVSYTLGSLSNPFPNALLPKAWLLRVGSSTALRSRLLADYDVYSEVIGNEISEERRIRGAE